jgi:hypothetical protein
MHAHSAKYFRGVTRRKRGEQWAEQAGAGCGWGVLVAQLGEAVFAKWAGQIATERVHLDSKPLRRHITSTQGPNS